MSPHTIPVHRHGALLTGCALAAGDLVALLAAYLVGILVRLCFSGFTSELSLGQYLGFAPMAGLFLAAYAVGGGYPGIPYHSAEELRRTTWLTTLVIVLLAALTFLVRGGLPPRSLLLGTWLAALFLVPLGRHLVRRLAARRPWWGAPVIVLGAGRTGERIAVELRRRPEIGYRVVAMVDDDPATHGTVAGVQVVGGLERADVLARELGVTTAMLAMPGVGQERVLEILSRHAREFQRIVIVPVFHGLPTLWVAARDLGGVLALEVRQNLLMPWPRIAKRALDLVLVIPALVVVGICVWPWVALITKIVSPGPLFYGQKRIGREGRTFTCWKFRSMRRDADAVLASYLAAHPELRAEWEATRKLKDDPRVTRFGAFIRRFSIDELPQFWNVLTGDMSLVGPRPIVDAEIAKYEGSFDLYCQVRPGVTGMWQVSGRSDTSYAERIALDSYYVRNWSVWIDLVILARTPLVAVFGRGAY